MVGIRTKTAMSVLHLQAARDLVNLCNEIEDAEREMDWPQPRQHELQAYASGAAMMSVAALESAINEFETTQGHIELYTKTTQDYNGLLDGERQLFNNGESSLFLVNSRELGFINAQIKLIELVTKNKNAVLKLNYALGNLN